MSELIEETVLRIKELQDQVDKVLFYEWDPLGVSTMDYMRDEYSRYVLEVVEIALECSSYEAIEEELVLVRKEWMGMEENTEQDNKVARTIYSLAQQYSGQQ